MPTEKTGSDKSIEEVPTLKSTGRPVRLYAEASFSALARRSRASSRAHTLISVSGLAQRQTAVNAMAPYMSVYQGISQSSHLRTWPGARG